MSFNYALIVKYSQLPNIAINFEIYVRLISDHLVLIV